MSTGADTHLLALLIAALGHTSIIYILLKKGQNRRINIYFSLFLSSIIVWGLLNYLALLTPSLGLRLWLIRGVLLLAIVQTALFFIFSRVYPDGHRLTKTTWVPTLILAAVSGALALTPYVFSGLEKSPQDLNGITVMGPAFFIFAVSVTIFTGLGLVELYQKMFDLEKRVIKKNVPVFAGALVMYLLVFSLDFILPALYHNSSFISWSPVLSLPISLWMVYAILKYGALDAGITFSKKAVVATTVIALMFGLLFLLL